jgi:hypothetical protein
MNHLLPRQTESLHQRLDLVIANVLFLAKLPIPFLPSRPNLVLPSVAVSGFSIRSNPPPASFPVLLSRAAMAVK